MTHPALKQSLYVNPDRVQQEASDPAASVWVNASAGSGKTKVLTERVMRLLLSGVLPQKILCLTYTRAGAAEMTNRITQRLSKWATCADKELDDDLDALQGKQAASKQRSEARRLFARVLSCPGGLRIRTIHSFCQEILSRFPIESGLPPHFALIDDQDMHVLHNEVLDDLLREAAENPQAEIAQALNVLVNAQGETGVTSMLQEVIHARGRLNDAVDAAGGEKKYIAKMRTGLNLGPHDTAEKFRISFIKNIPENEMKAMAGWLLTAKPDSLSGKRGKKLAAILETNQSDRHKQFDTYLSVFLTQKLTPLSPTYVASKEIRSKHPEIDELSSNEALRLLSALERIEAAEIAQITESVLTFGSAFSNKLKARKTSRAVLDYDDLILLTENLLQRSGIAPWILYKLDNGIDHVLVDEAQDTSSAQWNIVQALTSEFYAGEGAHKNHSRTLFVVGDEKQSIFSFQNADPEAFLAYRDFFAQRLNDAEKSLKKIGLHTSFRSAPAILQAVDAIFASDAARYGVSSEPVTHSAFPNKDGSHKTGRVEVWPLLKETKENTKSDGTWIVPTEYEDDQDPQYELAQQIAKKIKHWLTKRETLPNINKPITAGDIMILLRRRGRFASLMVRALKAHDVPVTGVDRMHLIKQLPVLDLLSMLRFVLLPEDDLNLATLLRSPLLGLTENQLMELAIGRNGSLWQSLLTKPTYKTISDYLAAKLNEADFSTPFAFLSHILNAPCPANTVSGRQALWSRLGEESLDPIEELLNEAQNYTRNHPPSLQNFLHWLTQSDKEIKRELDHGNQQKGGQVRIMTVHASKGLEAPIVFLPDTTALPRTADLPRLQWMEKDAAIFLPRQPNFGSARTIWQKARDKQIQEYRRLFYVALTRAANRLYICGWLDSKVETVPTESWYALAQSALQPLHEEMYMISGELPAPEIVIANAVLASSPAPISIATPAPPPEPLPDWALLPVSKIPTQTSFLPTPSALDATATPDAAFARGRIIHRLLQSLPDIAPSNRAAAIARFLTQPRHDLTQPQRDEIANEVTALITNENFATLFAPDSLAEAPLTGTLNGIPVFRQIDRLCLRGDEIWIVDYKTNRPPPLREEDIPPSYRQQLDEYRTLLGAIYPDKKVRCFLLWTYAPRLMEMTF